MGAVRSGSSGPTSASGSAGAAAGVGVAEIKTALNAPAVANAAAAASSPAPTDSMCAKVTLQERESMGVDGDDTYNNNTVGAGAGGAGEGAMDVVEQAVGSADRGASALAAAVGTDTVTRADKHQDMVWSAGSDGNRIGGMAAHIQHSMSPVANAADTTANSSACSSGNMLNAVNTAPVAGGAAQGMEASYAVDVLVMPSPTQAPAPIATSALVPNITSSSSSSAGPNKRKLESSASASASGTASVPPACDDDDDDNLTPEELAWYIKQHQKNSSKMVSLAKNNRRIAQDASDREEAKRKEIYKKAQKGLTIQFRLLPMMKQPQSATSNTQTVVYMAPTGITMQQRLYFSEFYSAKRLDRDAQAGEWAVMDQKWVPEKNDLPINFMNIASHGSSMGGGYVPAVGGANGDSSNSSVSSNDRSNTNTPTDLDTNLTYEMLENDPLLLQRRYNLGRELSHREMAKPFIRVEMTAKVRDIKAYIKQKKKRECDSLAVCTPAIASDGYSKKSLSQVKDLYPYNFELFVFYNQAMMHLDDEKTLKSICKDLWTCDGPLDVYYCAKDGF